MTRLALLVRCVHVPLFWILFDACILFAQSLERQIVERDSGATKVAFSDDGRLVAAALKNRSIIVRTVANNQTVFRQAAQDELFLGVAISPDGKILASCGSRLSQGRPGAIDETATIHLWNIKNGEKIKTISGGKGIFYSVTFGPRGRTLAAGGGELFLSRSLPITVWDVASGKTISEMKGGTSHFVSLRFSPSGQFLAAVSGVEGWGELNVWDISNNSHVFSYAHDDKSKYYDLSFNGNEQWIAVAGSSQKQGGVIGRLSIFDLRSKKIAKSVPGLTGAVRSVAFVPSFNNWVCAGCDGNLLFTGWV